MVFEDDKRVYFVVETKDTGTRVVVCKLHPSERLKICCGEAHFKQLESLKYRVINKVSELAVALKDNRNKRPI